MGYPSAARGVARTRGVVHTSSQSFSATNERDSRRVRPQRRPRLRPAIARCQRTVRCTIFQSRARQHVQASPVIFLFDTRPISRLVKRIAVRIRAATNTLHDLCRTEEPCPLSIFAEELQFPVCGREALHDSSTTLVREIRDWFDRQNRSTAMLKACLDPHGALRLSRAGACPVDAGYLPILLLHFKGTTRMTANTKQTRTRVFRLNRTPRPRR